MRVPVNVEIYVLINVCMNMITIGAIARARGRVRLGSVVFASLFGALYAVAMQTEVFQLLHVWPLRLILVALMVACAIPVKGLWDYLGAILMVVTATALMGGIQMWARAALRGPSGSALSVGALSGAALLLGALRHRRQTLERFEAQMLIGYRGRRVRLSALIDTGNRLHEPISGLPVLIVSRRCLRRLIPQNLDADSPGFRLPAGFRLAAYGTLGGGGQMAVFRPDELLVSYGDGYMAAPDLWVGIYPGDMPGGVQALAPGVIGTIKAPHSARHAHKNRVFYRAFK